MNYKKYIKEKEDLEDKLNRLELSVFKYLESIDLSIEHRAVTEDGIVRQIHRIDLVNDKIMCKPNKKDVLSSGIPLGSFYSVIDTSDIVDIYSMSKSDGGHIND